MVHFHLPLVAGGRVAAARKKYLASSFFKYLLMFIICLIEKKLIHTEDLHRKPFFNMNYVPMRNLLYISLRRRIVKCHFQNLIALDI